MKLTFPDTLKVCQTELVNGKPKITETKSFIYITYSKLANAIRANIE
jgi:hypothetical protein